MRRFVTLLLAAAMLAACTAQTPSAPPAADVDAVQVPTPIDAPAVTPRSTPAPTPVSTPDATPAQTGDDAVYTAFIERTADNAASAPFAEWFKAIDSDDMERLADASRKLRTANLIFVDWLDAHPPRACYEQMWTLTRAGAAAFAKAQSYYAKWARSGRHADFVKADDLTHKWGENAERASALISSNECPK